MNEPTSLSILERLRVNASARRQASLTRLVEACDYLITKGPIKLSGIEAFIVKSSGRGAGPKAQTISNEKSRDLGMHHYVEARNRERLVAGRSAGLQRGVGTKLDVVRMIETIDDMDVRTEMRDLVDRAKLAEAALARAKHVLKTFRPGVDIDAFLAGREPNRPESSGALDTRNTASLIRVINILTDNGRLLNCGLAYEEGRVRRRIGTRDELVDVDTMATLVALRDRLSEEAQPPMSAPSY